VGRGPGAGSVALLACVLLLASAGSAGASAPTAPRIVGGGKANAAGWQFAVALGLSRSFICTGSLIAPTKVLTAPTA
jgi:secreted trypsin-like serine protease